MERIESKQAMAIHENNRQLENAKMVGLQCEEVARDIKFNLAGQTDKMQNSILRNLKSIQGETGIANRLLTMIKKERMKNKLVLYSILVFLVISVLVIIKVSWL